LWLPAHGGRSQAPAGGVVVVHGAGSRKEGHHDFARAAGAAGLAVICFDQRGHGASGGRLDGRAIEDVAGMAALLRERLGHPQAPVALRGSSMGGYLAIQAARPAMAAAVVAICPAGADGLRRGLLAGRLGFAADVDAVVTLLDNHGLPEAVASLDVPLLLLHAEGDERVPVEQSRELAGLARARSSRLITVPGGHHQSVQHDDELQAVSVRFIQRAFAGS
jgi:pimeloyl-ACP methyl ester carboxylesterase